MSFFQYILNINKKQQLASDFILGNHNIETYNYIRQFPNWSNKIIFLNGPDGSGKNHICKFWQSFSNAVKIELFNDNEKNLNQILESNNCFIIENLEIYFSRKYILRNLDNHDFECLQKTIFSILDHVINENKFLLISSEITAVDMNITLADLKSRLMSFATLKLKTPDDQALKTFLIKEFSSRQLKINNDICEYILKRSVRSFDQLNDLINKIDNLALHNKRNITKPFIKEVIDNELQQ